MTSNKKYPNLEVSESQDRWLCVVSLSWMVLPKISPKLLTTNLQSFYRARGAAPKIPSMAVSWRPRFLSHRPVHMTACNNSILPPPDRSKWFKKERERRRGCQNRNQQHFYDLIPEVICQYLWIILVPEMTPSTVLEGTLCNKGRGIKMSSLGENLKAIRVYHPDSIPSICSVSKTGNEEMW